MLFWVAANNTHHGSCLCPTSSDVRGSICEAGQPARPRAATDGPTSRDKHARLVLSPVLPAEPFACLKVQTLWICEASSGCRKHFCLRFYLNKGCARSDSKAFSSLSPTVCAVSRNHSQHNKQNPVQHCISSLLVEALEHMYVRRTPTCSGRPALKATLEEAMHATSSKKLRCRWFLTKAASTMTDY